MREPGSSGVLDGLLGMRGSQPLLTPYRDKLFQGLAVAGTAVLLPFAVKNFLDGYAVLGATVLLIVAMFVIDAVAITRGRRPPVPPAYAFAPILAGLAAAIPARGLATVFWTYPALLLFHFVLERRVANLLNACLVIVVGPIVYATQGGELAVRVVATQVLTIVFSNIFSAIVEGEQRREAEQRRRLGLLARATQAGFFEWDAVNDSSSYSGRLREILGYAHDADMSRVGAFTDLIHPEDRDARRQAFAEAMRDRSVRNGVRRHRPAEYRVMHASGAPIWVHVEGISLTDAEGRTQRMIASVNDVTVRREQREALRRSRDQVEAQARQLERQNTELRDAIHVREEVERIARHDIKTPLNSILSVPRMLRDTGQLAPDQDALLGVVETAAHRILDMVNRTVDLYRMEQGSYEFRPEAVNLLALAEGVARELRSHAITKRVKIEVTLEAGGAAGDAPLAWAEEPLCYSILANLLKNAVEASPDDALVRVTLAAGPPVSLRVHNAGVVPEAVRATFFEKYATAGKPGGIGLGTYSARLMARVQQGELEMRTSAADGTTLSLRLGSPPPGAAGTPPPLATQAGEAASTAPLPALRVLVVDDDEFNVVYLKSNLPSPPLTVASAINGRAAVDAAAADPPDVVFMDLEMPVMNGFEALARLREQDAAAGRPACTVIAFTSYDDDESRRRIAEAGFDHSISKPAPREQIHALLRAVRAGAPPARAPAAPPQGLAGPRTPVTVDPELAAVLPRFVASRLGLIGELASTIDAGEHGVAARLAHKLAGSFALYGFDWARDESAAIERSLVDGRLGEVGERVDNLRRYVEAADIRVGKSPAA